MPERTIGGKIYRVLGWISLVGLSLVLILILHKSPAPEVPVDPAAAVRAEQKFSAIDEQRAAGQSGPASVTLDRTELNSFLAKDLQLQGSAPPTGATVAPQSGDPAPVPAGDAATLEQVQSSVEDVKVDMDGDLVKAYVVFDFHGKDMSLELEGHLGSQDGYLKFDPVSGKLGSMPIPQSMLQSTVDKMMASPENREKLRLPPEVSDVQIANGQAVVSYK